MDVFVEKWSKNCKKIRYVVDRKQDKFLDGILPFLPSNFALLSIAALSHV